MKIYLGSDHAGFELKQKLMVELPEYDWQDQGCYSLDSVDYPDFANKVCQVIEKNETQTSPENIFGLLICGSGQGMAIRANKFTHVRAALCWNTEVAALSREHNNANILCLGSRHTSLPLAVQIVKAFLATSFAGGRHAQRVEKISKSTNT